MRGGADLCWHHFGVVVYPGRFTGFHRSENLKSSLRALREDLQSVSRQLASISDRIGALELEVEEDSFSFVEAPRTPSPSWNLLEEGSAW